MTLTKLLPQDLLNDIVPAGQDKPMVGASKYYGTNASGDFGFFPLAGSSVLQFTNLAAFPVTGLPNTLYIDTTTNQAYEWNGTGYDLLGDNEVQPYVNFAGFPATGSEGVTYIDLATDLSYVWDPTTSTYVLQSSTAQRMVTRQTLTPTITTTADPLIPNAINLGGKDYYNFIVDYSGTAPSGGNWYADFSAHEVIYINLPNHDGHIESYIVGTNIGYIDENTDNYSMNTNINEIVLSSQAKGITPVSGLSTVSFTHLMHIKVDTGIALVMTGGTITMQYEDNIVEYIPA